MISVAAFSGFSVANKSFKKEVGGRFFSRDDYFKSTHHYLHCPLLQSRKGHQLAVCTGTYFAQPCQIVIVVIGVNAWGNKARTYWIWGRGNGCEEPGAVGETEDVYFCHEDCNESVAHRSCVLQRSH